MKITGERPVDGVTPDGLVALHTSGYQEISTRVGAGTVLDIGCGVGFGASLLEGPERQVLALDYDIEAATMAARRPDADLLVVCGDGGRIGLRSRSVDWVCSSHIIEHFVRPDVHVAEIARVLRPDGTAFVLTPNEPADLENPYHVHLFTEPSFRAALEAHFEEVWVGGHDGTPEVKADFAARRATAQKLLRLDVFGLRKRLPRKWYIAAYGAGTRLFYRLQAKSHAGGVTNISASDFRAVDEVDDTTLSLFAIARRPRAATSTR